MTGVDDEQAKTLIMKAREHWFTAEAEAAPDGNAAATTEMAAIAAAAQD